VYKARRLPVHPGPAGWRRLLASEQLRSYPALDRNLGADIVIVGAGFAGLFAAHRLTTLRSGSRIVVLEASEVAEGASGRNSGFMIDLPHSLTTEGYGDANQEHRQRIALNRCAIAFAAEAVERHAIDAGAFVRSGKINGAADAAGMAKNQRFADSLRALGEPFENFEAQTMREITGSRYYQGGLFTPGTVMLQPAQFIQGLAAGLARSVQIHERSPVRSLRRSDGQWQVATDRAQVSAPTVVLATNGHVESFGLFRHRLMHVFTFASMTRVLTDAERAVLGGHDTWALTPADPMGTTVRKIAGRSGHRVVVRNSFRYEPSMQVSPRRLAAAVAAHGKSFAARFPMLADVSMEYAWGGHLCLSRNEVNAFGAIDDGLYAACCCNGLGTVQSTLAGAAIAEMICGVGSDHLTALQAQPAPRIIPPGPWTAWAANALIAGRERRAALEK
jgi:glycine/D-amino acid oxidase-like deaminating enzyme